MSTKNLSRTVIEGGRDNFSRWWRRHSNAVHRQATRRASAAELASPEPGHVLYPRREVVYRGFSDKLSPAARWLDKQVGRPWNHVRGELMRRFDIRTTAGRHIVFDHLLPAVEGSRPAGLRRVAVFVDRHGLLQRAASSGRRARTRGE
jgi:hypothetical protein